MRACWSLTKTQTAACLWHKGRIMNHFFLFFSRLKQQNKKTKKKIDPLNSTWFILCSKISWKLWKCQIKVLRDEFDVETHRQHVRTQPFPACISGSTWVTPSHQNVYEDAASRWISAPVSLLHHRVQTTTMRATGPSPSAATWASSPPPPAIHPRPPDSDSRYEI